MFHVYPSKYSEDCSVEEGLALFIILKGKTWTNRLNVHVGGF